MKTRYIWLTLALAFSVTLAVVVGQRLSSEAMAVIVGVVAGVAASIPTSLVVVWFATRTLNHRDFEARPPTPNVSAQASRNAAGWAETPGAYPPAMPRMIVVQQPAAASPAGYMAPQYPLAGPQQLWPAGPQPRRYTVVGGADEIMDEFESDREVVWHH